MASLKWAFLTEVDTRIEADLLISFLEASGIEAVRFQDTVGHSIYPGAIERVQVFVSKRQVAEAHELLTSFRAHRQRGAGR